jgi:hypothetical protein
MLGGGNGAGTVLTWVLAGFLAQVSAWLGLLGCWRAWASGYSGAGGLGLWARALAGWGFGLGLAGRLAGWNTGASRFNSESQRRFDSESDGEFDSDATAGNSRLNRGSDGDGRTSDENFFAY